MICSPWFLCPNLVINRIIIYRKLSGKLSREIASTDRDNPSSRFLVVFSKQLDECWHFLTFCWQESCLFLESPGNWRQGWNCFGSGRRLFAPICPLLGLEDKLKPKLLWEALEEIEDHCQTLFRSFGQQFYYMQWHPG